MRWRQRGPVDGVFDQREFLLQFHAEPSIDVVANSARQEDGLEGNIVGVFEEVFAYVAAHKSSQFIIEANLVCGLMRTAVDGLELNAMRRPSKKSRGSNGIDGVGIVEVAHHNRTDTIHLESFWRRRLVLVLHDLLRVVDADGVVRAECRIPALDVAVGDVFRAAVHGGSVEAECAKGDDLLVNGYPSVGAADGVGPFHKAKGFGADGDVLGVNDAACQQSDDRE